MLNCSTATFWKQNWETMFETRYLSNFDWFNVCYSPERFADKRNLSAGQRIVSVEFRMQTFKCVFHFSVQTKLNVLKRDIENRLKHIWLRLMIWVWRMSYQNKKNSISFFCVFYVITQYFVGPIGFFEPREVYPLVSKILVTPLTERRFAVDYQKIIDAFPNQHKHTRILLNCYLFIFLVSFYFRSHNFA
jgi:hypothetical protein